MRRSCYFFIPLLFLLACQGPTEKFKDVTSDGVRIAYRIAGKGDTTLLFLHGWCINQHYWDNQVGFFEPRYTVVTMDLPGFGDSRGTRSAWTIEQYGKDVDQLIRDLDLKNVILIGHSMSGDIMLEAVHQDSTSVIGMIGIDNLKDVKDVIPEETKHNYALVIDTLRKDYQNIAEQICRQTLFHPSTDSAVVARVIDDVKHTDSLVAISSLQSLAEYSAMEATRLGQVPLKLYLLNSDATPTDENALKKCCRKGFDITPIHATGHYPMLEKPEAFNKLLQQIIFRIGKK